MRKMVCSFLAASQLHRPALVLRRRLLPPRPSFATASMAASSPPSFAPTAILLATADTDAGAERLAARARALAERYPELPLVAADNAAAAAAAAAADGFEFGLQYQPGSERLGLLTLTVPANSGEAADVGAGGGAARGGEGRRARGKGKKRGREGGGARANAMVLDFAAIEAKRGGGKGGGAELVVKACRGKSNKPPLGLVWDMTAGLGRDSAVLVSSSDSVSRALRVVRRASCVVRRASRVMAPLPYPTPPMLRMRTLPHPGESTYVRTMHCDGGAARGCATFPGSQRRRRG